MGNTLLKNAAELMSSPVSLAALLAMILFLAFIVYFRKTVITTKTLAAIGMALALTVILHAVRLYHLPQGGSITLGSMLPLLLISFRYGPLMGYLGGVVYGFINLLQDPYVLSPVQVLFDYPLPYMALGIAGYFKERVFIGAICGIFARFICHFISGIVFFASYAPPGMSPYWYSLVVNVSYLLPEMAICLVLLKMLPIERMLKYMK